MQTIPPHCVSGPFWSTAAFGAATAPSPRELSALGEHLRLCRAAHSRLFALGCIAQSARGFLATRCVTTLLVVVVAVAALSLL
jgi:hypothetical protein